ncbi:hypothetical protein BJ878DRAFT_10347 [Calycina marina]|uniref:Uncharacterized protein n=1 Tax=Calycina marina TaxID=1763456 RepID=A0A9P7Z5D4_9HELO|nr:hypothetical protein BJ878DRAFT_10347 [Calycina marina]
MEKQREDFGSMATRRARGVSKQFGRHSRISKATCKMLIYKDRNPFRKQPFMIEQFKLPVGKCQLQRKLCEYTKGYRRLNARSLRRLYRQRNGGSSRHMAGSMATKVLTISGPTRSSSTRHISTLAHRLLEIYWQKKTRGTTPRTLENGSHVRGASFTSLLRSHGEGNQSFSSMTMNKITKSVLPYPRKPRRPKTESLEDYNALVQEWDAGKPHDVEVKVKGNHVTQKH